MTSSSTSTAAADAPRPAGDTSALRSKAMRGSAWTIAGYAASQLLRFGGNLVLSRLLFPGAFGVMTLLTLLLMGIQMMSDVGFGQCVIQHPRGNERSFQNTIWTMQILRGIGAFLLLASGGWLIWLVYGNPTYEGVPRMTLYVLLVALSGLIAAFDSTKVYLASRTLSVRRLVALDLGAQAIGLAVMVMWAMWNPSLGALVGGEIVRAFVRMAGSHLLLPGPLNRFGWDREAVRFVLGFGKWVAASSAMTFVAMQSDRLVLAKLVSVDVLGIYGIALMLASLPAVVLSRLGISLLFPALAERRRVEPASFGAALLRVRSTLLPITLTASVAITTFSPAIFQFFYDVRYHAAVWICPALSLYVWFSALQASCDRALLVLGQSRALAVSRIVNFVTTVAGCFIGFRLGALPGLVIGVTSSNLFGHLVVMVALARSGISILAQDLRYSAAMILLCGAGWYGQHLALDGVTDLHALARRAPLLVVLPALVALWALRRVRGQLAPRPAPAAVPPPTPAA